MNVPRALVNWIESWSRHEAIFEHGFNLNTGWWNQRIADLPGGLVAEGANTAHISRGDLFTMADAALTSGEGALQLLWHTLAWGSGNYHRNDPRRISSVRADPQGVGQMLSQAAQASRRDPAEAFNVLKPNRNAIKQLGPNFFTKYLYFAGGGEPLHRSLIVDRRVLDTLYRETQREEFLVRYNYGLGTYMQAIEILEAWACELSTRERRVAADEVERWAFQAR
jgi:hypothetical protein